ncbi:MAG: hypothetical protein ACI82E_000261 [Nonlabens sp.]|jgi:hypothetical protein
MKKIVFTVLTSIFTISICFSQDIMTKKSGEDIQAKVLEVTTSEIKYKKFDNQNGPTYTILKSDVVMVRYKNGTKDIFTDVNKNEAVFAPSIINGDLKATIYFIRATGFMTSVTPFTAFIDKQLVCKLNNNKYSIHQVDPGKHIFTVQFDGNEAKAKAEPITINVEAGKTYYVQMLLQASLVVSNLYCQEVTEMSAKTVLPSLKIDNDCM